MNFIELKELVKKLGGIVVMNGNIPEFVILSYANYKRIEELKNPPAGPDSAVGAGGKPDPSEGDAIEKLNREILALKEEIRQKEEAEILHSGEETLNSPPAESETEESLL